LRADIPKSSLPPDVKERLIALAGRHVTTDGVLVLVRQAHGSQAQNRDAARDRLVALLKRAAKPPAKRKPTTPRAAARETRLISKKRHGQSNVLEASGTRRAHVRLLGRRVAARGIDEDAAAIAKSPD